MISETSAKLVLEAALSSGGDFAELYMEDTVSNSLVMVNGDVDNATSARMTGAGVRVFSGVRSAYAYTADTSRDALIGAAKAAAAALSSGEHSSVIPFRPADYSGCAAYPIRYCGQCRADRQNAGGASRRKVLFRRNFPGDRQPGRCG